MAAEADKTRKLDFEEIQIPPGPRLGSVVVEAEKLTKGFGDRVLIDDLSFTLPRNGIVGVIGPNGAGKTTLFKMIVGEEKPDAGEIKVGETVKLSYVDQSRGGIDPKKTLWEVVSDGLDYIKVGNVEMPSRAYVAAFGFKGPDQQKPAGVLSGGERNRLNLALTLKQGGNLLLLDEPTNDLDVETLTSLENALLEFPGCAVVVSHDRWFLDRVATHILAYEGTRTRKWFWFEGNFEAYEKNKVERLGAEAARPHRVDLPQAHPRLTLMPTRRWPWVSGATASRCLAHRVRSGACLATTYASPCAGATWTPSPTSTTSPTSATSRRRASTCSSCVGRSPGVAALRDGVVVARHEIDYVAPLVWHPRGIDIDVWVERVGGASFDLAYVVQDSERVYARARSTLVAFDLAAGRARRLTSEERAFLQRFADDEPRGA